jgi:DNA-binding MarR family transcriptional regulator
MKKTYIFNYLKARKIQQALKGYDPSLGIKEIDVLFELYLTRRTWVSFDYLRKKTVQSNSELSFRSLAPLETKGYVEKRIRKDHRGEARITPKGKRLVDRL